MLDSSSILKNMHFFASGRNAMHAACDLLNLKPNDEVLTPAFDCDGALQPFRLKNLSLKFYRIHPDTFEIDLDHIQTLLSKKTKLFHVINYFGISQNWNKILEFKKSTNIPILEDNAYCLFSMESQNPLKSLVDFSFFSLRKLLNFPDGGILINNTSLKIPKLQHSPYIHAFDQHFLNWGLSQIGITKIPSILKRSIQPKMPINENGTIPWVLSRDKIPTSFSKNPLQPISKLSLYLFKKYIQNGTLHKMINQKKKLHMLMVKEIINVDFIKVLNPTLNTEAAPFGVCLLMNEKINRDFIFQKFSSKYPLLTWPTFSMDILKKRPYFPEVDILGKRLLIFCFPLDEILKPRFEKTCLEFTQDLKRLFKMSFKKLY